MSMSTVPNSEIEIKDLSESKKLKRILFGVLLLLLVIGIFGFSMTEMAAADKAKKGDEIIRAAKIDKVPEILNQVIDDLNKFKAEFSVNKATDKIAMALDHIHSGVEELNVAKKLMNSE